MSLQAEHAAQIPNRSVTKTVPMAKMIQCIECGSPASCAAWACPKCRCPPLGTRCDVCQSIGKVAELVKRGDGRDPRFLHPGCLLEVKKECHAPMYTCPVCKQTDPIFRLPDHSQHAVCQHCGGPGLGKKIWQVGLWVSSCIYCREGIVPAYGHRDTSVHSWVAHRVCFRARHPIRGWLYQLFSKYRSLVEAGCDQGLGQRGEGEAPAEPEGAGSAGASPSRAAEPVITAVEAQKTNAQEAGTKAAKPDANRLVPCHECGAHISPDSHATCIKCHSRFPFAAARFAMSHSSTPQPWQADGLEFIGCA